MSTIAVPNTTSVGQIFRWFAGSRPRWLAATVVLLLIVAGAAFAAARARSAVAYVTVPVAQQSLVQTVTASGTVNPQNNISVGTQVSGTIASIAVDYNSRVKKGQVLARLDPSTLQAQLDQARAAVAQAQGQASMANANENGAASGIGVAAANARAEQAAVGAAQANAQKTQAAVTLAQQTLARDSALLKQGYIAQATVDADRANVASDEADVASSQASIAQAQAQAAAGSATVGQNGDTAQAQAANAQSAAANVAAAEAVVKQDEINLQHTIITSPVDGTVVARDVSVGQTVAASLQTPTLFAIAQNLGKMEVDINVGEPDIGNVKPGETVDFTVLAFPNRTFHGTVSQVRINPQTVNNVVTYDVVVLVNNGDGALLPGMTANASIDVANANGALVVPINALQWKPQFGRQHAKQTQSGATAGSPWGATAGGSGASATITAGSQGAVFVQQGSKLHRVPVIVDLVTSTQAAVVPAAGSSLKAGDAVVVASSGGSTHTSSASASRAPGAGGMSPGAGGMSPGVMRGIH